MSSLPNKTTNKVHALNVGPKVYTFPNANAAFIITLFTPTWLILNGAEIDMGYFGYHRLAWFFYSFIMLCSLTTFICFSQGIYPSEYQWNKKTYN